CRRARQHRGYSPAVAASSRRPGTAGGRRCLPEWMSARGFWHRACSLPVVRANPPLNEKETVMRTSLRGIGLLVVLAAGAAALPAPAADDKVGPDEKDVQALREKAHAYLKSKQSKDGSLSAKFFGPGPTGLVVAALARNGYKDDDPVVKKAV